MIFFFLNPGMFMAKQDWLYMSRKDYYMNILLILRILIFRVSGSRQGSRTPDKYSTLMCTESILIPWGAAWQLKGQLWRKCLISGKML